MAVNAGEPLPDAEQMYREALRLPRRNDPLFASIMNSRIGMLRLRQGDLVEGERVLRDAEPALRANGDPFTEIVPALYARAFGEDVRGRYPEAVRLMSEALDLVVRRRFTFMGPDELALQLAAYEALAGNPGALPRLRDVEGRLPSVAAVDRIRHDLFAGIVEARYGSKAAAEGHLRSALATQQKEMGQPDISVEIYVRLIELLRALGREQEAAEAARQGLHAAALAYGSYFAGHPFAIEMQKAFSELASDGLARPNRMRHQRGTGKPSARAVRREAREKLLEAARRREIDLVPDTDLVGVMPGTGYPSLVDYSIIGQ
jgi:tetratricopeptide (TPR) repeat protein